MVKKIIHSSQKVRKFFKDPRHKNRWQPIVGLLIILLFVGASIAFNQDAWAQFYRTEGTTGFSYGYGYGYDLGFGYGFGYYETQGQAEYGFFGDDGKATLVSAAGSSNNALIISYTTSYYAKNKVYYGTTNTGTCSTLGSSSSQTNYQTGSNSITLSNLSCETIYYYCVASEDAGGNTWPTSISSQSTAACAGGGGGGGGGAVITPTPTPTVPATQTAESTVTAAEGGTVSLTTSEGSSAKITIPAGVVSADVTVSIKSTAATTLVSEGTVGATPAALYRVGNLVFHITVTDAKGNAVSEFSEAVTLTFSYTDEQIKDLDENTLKVYKWNGTAWVALDSTVDTKNNTISATTTSLSYFAIMGEKEEVIKEKKPVTKMTKSEIKAKIKEVIAQLISLIQELILQLQAQLQELVGAAKTLDTNLSSGSRGDDVELLQTWLAKDPEIYPEGIVSGWFGSLTKQAVQRFQEKYVDEILTPLGLTAGTGYVGESTRTKLNELYSGK